jgi:transcriptional regulator with XRE-family HTH domain
VKKKKIHLSDKIKRIRSFKGYTQYDLAKGIGKTRTLISHFERTGNINKYTLAEIADFLCVSIDDIENIGEEIFMSANGDFSKEEHFIWLKNLVEEQKAEISFLKKTIAQQMDVLQKLSEKKYQIALNQNELMQRFDQSATHLNPVCSKPVSVAVFILELTL